MPLLLLLAPLLESLGKIIGGPFAKAAVDAYKAKLDAGNSSEKIAADLAGRELEIEQREAELRTQLQIAEQGRWYTAIIRPLFALPFIIFNFKLIVWDKVLALGATDPLSKDLLSLEATIIMFYFGGRTIENVTRILKRK